MKSKFKPAYNITKSALVTIGLHWFVIVFLAYICLSLIQFHLIWPIETIYFPDLSVYVSLLFLPHSVRVIAAWLLGPKAILALFPATVISGYIFDSTIDNSLIFYLNSLFSSASAIIAFEFLKLMKMNVYPRGEWMTSWRNVIFAGCLASFFNSLGNAYFMGAYIGANELFEIIFRFITGDILGLLISMFVLMILFRYDKHIRI
ncbi:hypothetical protein N9X12_05950 [Alphaproteobacteria bacterium]|nr:hypothetical protein [Alphaproteobacteria bacterium]